MYVREVRTGLCDGKAVPVVIKETPATAYVNGNNGIGPVSDPFLLRVCKLNMTHGFRVLSELYVIYILYMSIQRPGQE